MGDLAMDLRLDGSDGRYTGVIGPDWVIWTPNGGFLASLALRAAGAETSLPLPAAITCHYLNVPELGVIELEVARLRASRRAESFRVSMRQGERPIVESLVWTAAEQHDGLAHEFARMPDVSPPEQLAPWTPRDGEPEGDGVLPLWRNIDARLEGWPEGQPWEQRTEGPPLRHDWCRFRPRATFDDPYVDAARAIIAMDTLMFPAALMKHPEPMTHFAPSLDLSVWLHRPSSGSEWLLVETSSPVAERGLVGGVARVWTRDGRIVASGGQQMLGRRVDGFVATTVPDEIGARSA